MIDAKPLTPAAEADLRFKMKSHRYAHGGIGWTTVKALLASLDAERGLADHLADALEITYDRFRDDHDHEGADCPKACHDVGDPDVVEVAAQAAFAAHLERRQQFAAKKPHP